MRNGCNFASASMCWPMVENLLTHASIGLNNLNGSVGHGNGSTQHEMSSSYDTQLGFTSSSPVSMPALDWWWRVIHAWIYICIYIYTIASVSGDMILREFSGMQTANCDRLIWWVFLPNSLVFIQHSFYFAEIRGINKCTMHILIAHGEIPAPGSVHP